MVVLKRLGVQHSQFMRIIHILNHVLKQLFIISSLTSQCIFNMVGVHNKKFIECNDFEMTNDA